MTDAMRSAPEGRPGRDRGQAAVLLIVVVAVLATATMSGIGRLGANVRDRVARPIDRRRGRAGVTRRWPGTGRWPLSAAHGATLVSWSDGPGAGEVTVVVRVGSRVGDGAGFRRPGPGRWPLTGPLPGSCVHLFT